MVARMVEEVQKDVPQGPRFRDKDGIRKVPFLVNSQGFPFIRIKRHQPRNLSRVLRQKRDKYWQRSNIVHFIEEYFQPLERYEDEWEELIQNQQGNLAGCVKDRDGREQKEEEKGTYLEEMEDAHREARDLWYGMRDKQIQLADRMRTIVQTEKQLAEEERARAIKQGKIKKDSSSLVKKSNRPTSQW